MKVFIKNIVSTPFKIMVRSELNKIDLLYSSVEFGEAVVDDALTAQQVEKVNAGLWNYGLGLMNNRRSLTIEKIKVVIIEMTRYLDALPKIKFSD